MALNTALEHTTVSAGNRGVWTFSFWLKRSGLEDEQTFYSEKSDANDFFKFSFTSADKLEIQNKDNGSNNLVYITTRVFRDLTSWTHFVFAYDKAQSSASDRFRVWINGVAETTWDSSALPAQDNTDIAVSKGSSGTYNPRVGKYDASTYYDGYMAQVVKVDGQSLAASNFGSFDDTTGEWQPKGDGEIRTAVNAGSGFGTTGWLLNFSDASNLGYDYKTADRSSNLDFTLGGSGRQTQDNPSNNFATWNPLFVPTGSNANYAINFEHGANFVQPTSPDANGSRTWSCSTLAMPTSGGKFYAEFKLIANDKVLQIGIVGTQQATERFHYNNVVSDCLNGIVYDMAADRIRGNSTDIVGSLTVPSDGDIIGIAVDMDNKLFYTYLNGTLLNTGGSSFSFFTEPFAYFFVGDSTTSGYDIISSNFGNGYFKETAIASEGTNASGIGKFEHNVPAGFTALSTKGLNE